MYKNTIAEPTIGSKTEKMNTTIEVIANKRPLRELLFLMRFNDNIPKTKEATPENKYICIRGITKLINHLSEVGKISKKLREDGVSARIKEIQTNQITIWQGTSSIPGMDSKKAATAKNDTLGLTGGCSCWLVSMIVIVN